VYDAELERMNTPLAAENQTLQHDNKQLGALIREYEQTLESVMSAFRRRAVRAYIQVLTTNDKNISSSPSTNMIRCSVYVRSPR
jgi:hypothetical protein